MNIKTVKTRQIKKMIVLLYKMHVLLYNDSAGRGARIRVRIFFCLRRNISVYQYILESEYYEKNSIF